MRKTVAGKVAASGKPKPDVFVAPRGVSRLRRVPDAFEWMSFEHAGRIITVGKLAGVREPGEARILGVWC